MRIPPAMAHTQPRGITCCSSPGHLSLPTDMDTKLPCPTRSSPKQLPAGLGIVKNAAFSFLLPFFFFFAFFPTSFLSLFLFRLFPPLTRFVRSWVGSLVMSTHSPFWKSDSGPTLASPKILILFPKMRHIYSSGAL